MQNGDLHLISLANLCWAAQDDHWAPSNVFDAAFGWPLVGLWVCPLVCGLVRYTFVKIAKSIGKSSFFLQFYASIHSLVCLSTYLSVFPLFSPFDWPSIHTYICNHIVKIAKSIAKLSESNGNQWYNSMERHNINRRKKISIKRLHWKAALLFVQTYLAYLLFHCWCLEPNGWWC